MLDEFIRQTGYNRKYALHLLTHWGKETFLTVEGKPMWFCFLAEDLFAQRSARDRSGNPASPPQAGRGIGADSPVRRVRRMRPNSQV
jgi:hypothetical protein